MIIKTDKETRERMCWLLRMEIAKNAQHGAKHWIGEKVDWLMWDVTVSDTDDLLKVHDLIESNDISQAFESASNLDTAVRDVIPTEVWNWMSNVWAGNREEPDHPRYSKTKSLVEEDSGLDPDGEWDHIEDSLNEE